MITAASFKDHSDIIELWESSVRATHRFISEEYIREIKTLLPGILPKVKLYAWRDEDGTIKGFAGVAHEKMEMLFIHPDSFGKGLGRQLAFFCIHSLNVDHVDVNDENEAAIKFYEKIGYQPIGRDEFDSEGRPHPILHLKYFSRSVS
jgi:putative acetyltransferase